MGLLQRRQQIGNNLPLYSIAGQKTVLIIGLGNPGKDYDGTRHNIGFAILDEFAAKNDFPAWIDKKDLKCQFTQHILGTTKVYLCKPTTFMNLSGEAAGALQRYYRLYNKDTVVVHDELAINFGQIRTRIGGEAAGHNGVKSLLQHLGDDFGRVRIGIGSELQKPAETADFVLQKFSKKEQELLPQVIREANAILTEYIFGGELPHDTRTVG